MRVYVVYNSVMDDYVGSFLARNNGAAARIFSDNLKRASKDNPELIVDDFELYFVAELVADDCELIPCELDFGTSTKNNEVKQ